MWNKKNKSPDPETLNMVECASIESLIMANQMRWVWRIVRSEDQMITKHLFYGEVLQGKRTKPKAKKTLQRRH